MEFQTINNKNKRRMVVGSILLVGILSIGIFAASRAKYKVTDTVKLGEGTVNYTLPDINIVGMYLVENGTETEINKDPGGGYVLMDKSYCNDKNGNKDTSVTLGTIDGSTTFENLGKGSKCYLYFEKEIPANKTLAKLNLTAVSCPTSFTGVSGSSEAKLCSGAQDQDGDTYYFRGNVTNNWVKFAGLYWRIIRINGDGSIRMIYNGTSTTTTGTGTQIGTKAFNSAYNRAEYVGLQYTIGEQRGTGTNSTVLGTTTSTDTTTLYGWYNTKIKGTSYEKYVDTNAVFCSDRDVASGQSGYTGTTGTGSIATMFNSGDRFFIANGSNWKTTQVPVMTCATNNQLLLPVGLITANEVVFAGGFGGKSSSSYYLYTNQNYWTMSPFDKNSNYANVFYLDLSGMLFWSNVHLTNIGVRPVINLRSDVKLTGSGSTGTPFEIIQS